MRVGAHTWHALDEAVGVGVRDQHVLQHAARNVQQQAAVTEWTQNACRALHQACP